MSYLAAAKRGISSEQEWRKRIAEEKKRKKNLHLERDNPQLVIEFEKFAKENGFVVVREFKTGELYAISQTLAISFEFWVKSGDRLVFH